MERRRRRERERRAEITDAIDSLSETMIQIGNPQQVNTITITNTQEGAGAGSEAGAGGRAGEQQGASTAGAGTVRSNNLISTTSTSTSGTSIQRGSLNRTDVIISARDMLVRQDNRIQRLEEALRHARAGLPASAATADAHPPRAAAAASNSTSTSSTPGIVVAPHAASNERLLNTRDIESMMNAESTTTANTIASDPGSILSYLSLQQQQLQQHQQQQQRRQEIELLNQMMSLAGNGQRIPSTYYNHAVSRDPDFNGSRDGVPTNVTGAAGENSTMFAAAAATGRANSTGGYASTSFVPRADSAARMNYGSINPALWYQQQQQQYQQQEQEQQQPQQQEQQQPQQNQHQQQHQQQ